MKLCQFGNCKTEGELPVKVSVGGGDQRLAFCSETHAAAWLLTRASHHHDINVKLGAMAAYEVLKARLEQDGGL